MFDCLGWSKSQRPHDDEINKAFFDEVADELRLSPIGLLNAPMHRVAKMIADRTGGQLDIPDFILRMKIQVWAEEVIS